MLILTGNKRFARIMVPDETSKYYDLEDYTKAQIKLLCNMERPIGNNLVFMPDTHPGRVSTVGLTMDITDSVIMPILLGSDIGCGVATIPIKGKINKGEFQKLDTVIREQVPSGKHKHNISNMKANKLISAENLYQWLCKDRWYFCGNEITRDDIYTNLGTLGGGNHFIELDKSEDGTTYLTVHTGSRNIGNKIFEKYMDFSYKELKKTNPTIPYEYTYLENNIKDMYMIDVSKCVEFARCNRREIIKTICSEMKWKYKEQDIIDCPHNYITTSDNILRKGSIAAYKGKKVVIPVNSRDGLIIGTGLGNVIWNCSAPHGAGRITKRVDVADSHTVSEYKNLMKKADVYSPSINKDTLDEAPFVYRNLEYLKAANIEETIFIDQILKPIYNFKGGK